MNLAAFCPCPENLPGVKLRSSGLISLAEEISKLNNVDSMARLLLITLRSKMKKNTQDRNKYKLYNSERKGALGKLMLQPRCTLEESCAC